MDSRPNKPSLGFFLAIALLVQFYSRFAGAPFVDFALDDWRLLELGRSCSGLGDAWAMVLRWPDRPVGTGLLLSTFHLFDDWTAGYAIFGIVCNSAMLALTMLLVYTLTGDTRECFLAGMVFALVPNLTESYQWATMIPYGPGFVAYVAAALCWLRFTRGKSPFNLVASALLFGVGLATYEVGVALPFVLLFLENRRSWRRAAVACATLVGVCLVYIAWRSTGGFGTANNLLFPHRAVGFGLSDVIWNAKEIVRWWVGGRMGDTILNGLAGFDTLPLHQQRMFALISILTTAGICVLITRSEPGNKTPREAMPAGRVFLFALAWAAGTQVVSLVSWTGGRLNYLPAVGVAIGAAVLLNRIPARHWLVPAFPIILVCLAANQGTSAQWRDSASFQRNIFEYLARHERAWADRELVVFNTTQLCQRQAKHLVQPSLNDPSAWANYGNVGLMRGFALNSMLHLIRPGMTRPAGILDAEHGAHVEGDILAWHAWYDPRTQNRTALTNVFMVDCLAVGSGRQE
ncbi:MAG: hypothetical protein V1929_05400 [bacterium]